MSHVVKPPWTLPRWAVIRDARRRQRQRQRRVLAMIAAAVVATAVGWQIVGRAQSGPATASSLTVGGGVQRVPVDGTPLDTTTMGGHLWVLTCVRFREHGATCGAGYLIEIRAASGRVLKRTSVAHPTALASGDGVIWITHLDTNQVTRVNPQTGQTTATIHLHLAQPLSVAGQQGFAPSGISFDRGQVTVSSGLSYLAEINSRTARVTRIVWTDSEATSTTTANGLTWIADELDGVGTLTPNSTRVTPRQIPWGGQPLDIDTVAHGAGLIWALGWESSLTNPTAEISVVTAIDPQTGRIMHQWPVGSASTMLVTNSATYVNGSSDRQLVRLTPPQRTQRLLVPKIASLVAATPQALWATTQHGQLLRISLTQR